MVYLVFMEWPLLKSLIREEIYMLYKQYTKGHSSILCCVLFFACRKSLCLVVCSLMWAVIKVVWSEVENYWTQENVSWKTLREKMPTSLRTVSLGTQPVKQKHPWEEQLASLKYSWVPRNQRHPEIISISAKARKCNGNLSSEKVKNSLGTESKS